MTNGVYSIDVLGLIELNLKRLVVLDMHHADTFELAMFDLQGRELLLKTRNQLTAVSVFAGTLEVINMGAHNQHQSLGRCDPLRGTRPSGVDVPRVQLGI